MPYSLDPEIGAVLAALRAGAPPAPPPPVGDVESRRASADALLGAALGALPVPAGVTRVDATVTAEDGAAVPVRWYTRAGAPPGPAVLYAHGGGMIAGSLELYDPLVAHHVGLTGVPFLSVGYRCAPEHPAPTPVTDCYAALRWLHDRAAELGVDRGRVAVMGDSAGGGVVASLAVLARDRGGPAIARQVLVYPMLDDRTAVDPQLEPFLVWTSDDNATGWGALLGDAVGGPDVSPYAAAARVEDCGGLPPAYLDVGELDAFRDEDVAFARRLAAAGVSTELHVHPGAPHGFDVLAPGSAVALRAAADRVRVLTGL